MREIYGDTKAVIQSSPGYFLALTGLTVMLDWLDAHDSITVLIGFVATVQIYRHFLFAQPLSLVSPFRGARFASIARFAVVLVVMIIVPVAVIVAVAFGLMSPEVLTDDFERSANIFLVLFILSYGGILIVFGTALPATVAGEGIFASLSLERSRKTALDIGIGLLGGPAIIGAAYFAGTQYMTGSISYELDLSRLRPLVPAELARAVVLDLASTLQSILVAVILCHAYRKVRPRPEAERLVQVFS
jgi:hypothetical protein